MTVLCQREVEDTPCDDSRMRFGESQNINHMCIVKEDNRSDNGAKPRLVLNLSVAGNSTSCRRAAPLKPSSAFFGSVSDMQAHMGMRGEPTNLTLCCSQFARLVTDQMLLR